MNNGVCMMRFLRASFVWRLVAVLAALVVFGGAGAWAAALDLTPEEKAFIEAHPVVTVSDVDWPPLSIVADGRQQGLFHDYYALIAQRTGLAFRFQILGDGLDFQLVLDALRDKRIDLVDGTGKTADRATYALFAGPYWQFPLAVAARDDAAAWSLETLAGKRVAVARGSTAEEYLREKAPGLELVETADPYAALSLVATHKADAAVENMAVASYAIRKSGLANVKISGLLDYQFKIYSLVRNDWPLLASILQKAHESVTESEKAALLSRWLPLYKAGAQAGEAVAEVMGKPADTHTGLTFTDREKDYLARKKALSFCVDPDWAPIERIDENGRHVGIAADLLGLMSERLGVPVVLVPTSSWSQSLSAVREHRCDFLPAAGDTKQRRRFLHFTTPYLRFPMVVATLAKTPFIDDPAGLSGKDLGVVNGYSSLDILRSKYPEMRLVEVPSVTEGLRLVADGKLYGYIDTVPAISQAIAKDHFSDLKIAGRLDAQLDLAVASRDDEPELASLFQKAVNTLTKAETEAIIKKWVAVTFEESFDYTRFWKALAIAAAVLAVIVWWNRKLARLNRAIRQAHEALDVANRDMAALLDNAGQGFLSVDRNGLVGPRCSQECRTIFGGDIEGRNVVELLFPDDPAAREALAVNIRRVADEADAYRRDLYLSLMQKSAQLGGRALRLAYRALDGGRLMFVITDVTDEARLKDAVARERNRLACVVAAVREQRDFFAVLDSFAGFRESGQVFVSSAADGRAALESVYRQVHTFKGLFLQLECAHVAAALDAVETRLAGLAREDAPQASTVAEALADPEVDEALNRDIAVVRNALGEEFFDRRGEICLGADLAEALAELADRLLSRLDDLPLGEQDRTVLAAARTLRHVDVKKLLAAYPRLAARLAAGQGKLLAPFAVEGEAVAVDPDRLDALAKALVHAFRNAVDHGLETPAERAEAGKDEAGIINCRVAAENGRLVIEVADDGRGVDVEGVRSRAFEVGLVGAEELAAMDDAAVIELLFRDGFSSRRSVGELSGRGVGLAAVRAEAQHLGGAAVLISEPGRGSRLRVEVPLLDA
ncbi:putative sensor histidine kinase [Solidesulfovibrio magneticus RS-1]|uniref:histidine kinase n=2 Tax=Solidesulfovibrio TaxID=2910984 RepID=C4XHI7_SOLM1|nr:putative sensor histidine kinase [Solidesulfovibrio magneticus RS-1]